MVNNLPKSPSKRRLTREEPSLKKVTKLCAHSQSGNGVFFDILQMLFAEKETLFSGSDSEKPERLTNMVPSVLDHKSRFVDFVVNHMGATIERLGRTSANGTVVRKELHSTIDATFSALCQQTIKRASNDFDLVQGSRREQSMCIPHTRHAHARARMHMHRKTLRQDGHVYRHVYRDVYRDELAFHLPAQQNTVRGTLRAKHPSGAPKHMHAHACVRACA